MEDTQKVKLAAELDRIAEQVAGAREGFMPMGTTEYSRNVTQWHAPHLLAAVEAAIGFHVEAVIEGRGPNYPFHYCKTCSGHPAWPCPEVAAITQALA